MSIITKARLSAITASRIGTKTFSAVLNEAKTENRIYAAASIFLSHSHDDLEKGILDKAIVFLRTLGIRIYIDSQDTTLSPFTNAETARKIKQAVIDSNKFILLGSEKALKSKWCHWELGFGDAKKYPDKIALFPIAEDSVAWTGAEYLRIYPRIEETYIGSNVYKVFYPDGRQMEMLEWFRM